jgi:isochorismate synthase
MRGFGLFRLPYAEACTLVGGDVLSLTAISQLSDRHGFVVAPFAISEETPLLLISPEVVEHYAHPADIHELPEMSFLAALDYTHEGDERSDYHIDFANFHAQLEQDAFTKIVLARQMVVHTQQNVDPMQLFWDAWVWDTSGPDPKFHSITPDSMHT